MASMQPQANEVPIWLSYDFVVVYLVRHSFGTLSHTACCKWGRANGWGMLSHIEVLLAVHTAFPTHPLLSQLLQTYRERTKSILPFQDKASGMWRQVVNESSTYVETR
jgi:rhamnogalacturonyl hydrolase YesR